MIKITIPALIRNDFPRKLLALLLATVIWYTVRFEILKTESIPQIPVKLLYDSNKLAIEEAPPSVMLTFRAAKAKLDAIDPSELQVTIRIPDIDAGVYEYEVALSPRKHIKVPRGTRLVSVTPDRLVLKVDRIVSRTFPVEIKETGRLAPNHQILARSTIPEVVHVRGPSRYLEAMAAINTQPIPLEASLTDSFQMNEVGLVQIPRLSINPSSVTVVYEIVRDDNNRKFDDLPVRVLNRAPPRLTIAEPIPPVTVILRGPTAHLASLQPSKIHPYIDIGSLDEAGPSKLRISVRVDSPVQFTVEALTPTTVGVTLLDIAPAAPPEEDAPPPESATATDDEADGDGDGAATAPEGPPPGEGTDD